MKNEDCEVTLVRQYDFILSLKVDYKFFLQIFADKKYKWKKKHALVWFNVFLM